jgi:histidine decarboxylase
LGSLGDIVRGAVGPFARYSGGYGNPGASGIGYVTVLTLHIGKVPKTLQISGQNTEGLDGTLAFDNAEASDAYIGQINLIVASSFSGLNGAIWGYDIARAHEIVNRQLKPLFTVLQSDADIPVYPIEPLIDAGKRLFGTRDQKRFPMLPGSHIIAAHKEQIVSGPTTLWCGLGLGIAADRIRNANLFMEACGEFKPQATGEQEDQYFEQVKHNIAQSVIGVGKNQNVKYKEIFVGTKHDIIPDGYVGAALATIPYIVLAKDAVPTTGAQKLLQMTIKEWERDRHLPQSIR